MNSRLPKRLKNFGTAEEVRGSAIKADPLCFVRRPVPNAEQRFGRSYCLRGNVRAGARYSDADRIRRWVERQSVFRICAGVETKPEGRWPKHGPPKSMRSGLGEHRSERLQPLRSVPPEP